MRILWPEPLKFNVFGPFPVHYRGESDGALILRKYRIACPNSALRTFVVGSDFVSQVQCDFHLVGEKIPGIGARSVKSLKPVSPRHLLIFALKHIKVCREHCIVIPEVFQGCPVALVPQGDTFLLCAPRVDVLMPANPKVLVQNGV